MQEFNKVPGSRLIPYKPFASQVSRLLRCKDHINLRLNDFQEVILHLIGLFLDLFELFSIFWGFWLLDYHFAVDVVVGHHFVLK